jgi:hypothetical protein
MDRNTAVAVTPASADTRNPRSNAPVGVCRSQGMPCGVTLSSPCRVTEPTLSGTDVLRQLLTLTRRPPSRRGRQAVKEITIHVADLATAITISDRRRIAAYDFYCTAARTCADSQCADPRFTPLDECTHNRRIVSVAVSVLYRRPSSIKERVPAKPGLSGLDHDRCPLPRRTESTGFCHGEIVAVRLTPVNAEPARTRT